MDILERISRGDDGALGELLEECWDPLVRHLMTIVASSDQAKDAAQEAFVRMWAGRDHWKPGSAQGLLFRLGRNAALDMVRKEKVRSRWAHRWIGEDPEYSPSPVDEAIAADFTRRFQGALRELPLRRREVFELVRFQGLSYSEVATAMDLSPQTVANQMTLAHRDLRRLLGDLLSESGTEGSSGSERRSRDG